MAVTGWRNEPDAPARGRAMLLLVLTAVFWSFGGILIKFIQWHPMAISGMRSAIGALTILAVFRGLRFTGSRAQIGGAIAYAGTVTLFVLATKLTTAANAILLQYTAPVHVALFGPWLLGEPSRRRDVAAIAVILGGMALFFMDRLSTAGLWGNVAALGSGACFGWLTLFLRLQKGGSGIESIFLGNLLAAVLGLPFMFGSMPDARSWGGLVLLGTVQMGIPYVLFSMAVRHVPAVTAILVPMIEPVLNPVWVLLLLGETPSPMAVAGGAVILGTVAARCVADISCLQSDSGRL
jgi:drug/metabolite transporter (DMT)-like permease